MGKIEIPKYKGKLEGKDLEDFIEKHSKYWEGIDSVEYQRNLRDGVVAKSGGNNEDTSESTCNLQNVSKSFYCQREIEGNEMCEEQCAHCKEYYAPLEGQ